MHMNPKIECIGRFKEGGAMCDAISFIFMQFWEILAK